MQSKVSPNSSYVLLGAAALFLILFAGYSLLLRPTVDKLEEKRQEIATVSKQVGILEKKLSEKEGVKTSLPMEEIEGALPLWDNIEQITLDLRAIEASSQAKIDSITYSKSPKNDLQLLLKSKEPVFPTVQTVDVRAIVKGTYVQVTEVVEGLQKLPRLTYLDSIDFGTLKVNPRITEPVDNAKEIIVNLSFKTYFDPSYKDLKAAADALDKTDEAK